MVDLLDKARRRGSSLPYVELRELVREVRAHLDRTDARIGDAEMLVVMLKSLVPQHIKSQFSTCMMLLQRPPTGNNFLWYLHHELTEEIKALESDPRRQLGGGPKEPTAKDGGEKAKDKPPVLGRFYQAHKEPTPDSPDSDDSVSQGLALVNQGKREWPPYECCRLGNHGLHNCRKFVLLLSLKEKVATAKTLKACNKCLRVDHEFKDCPFKTRPDCRFCNSSQHHYFLCPGGEDPAIPGTTKVAAGSVTEVAEGLGFENLGELICNREISTLQLVANIEGADGRVVPANILPDTGSTHNILERKATRRAGLTGFECKYRVMGHGGHVTEHQAICGELTLVNPRNPSSRVKAKFYSYDNPCGGLQPVDWHQLKSGWPHLKGLDLPSPVPDQPVEMILGCTNLQIFEGVKPISVKGITNPIARLTKLGWIVSGRTRPEPPPDTQGEARIMEGEVGVAQKVGLVSNANQFKNAKSLSYLAELKVQAACGSETCERDYRELHRRLKRV